MLLFHFVLNLLSFTSIVYSFSSCERSIVTMNKEECKEIEGNVCEKEGIRLSWEPKGCNIISLTGRCFNSNSCISYKCQNHCETNPSCHWSDENRCSFKDEALEYRMLKKKKAKVTANPTSFPTTPTLGWCVAKETRCDAFGFPKQNSACAPISTANPLGCVCLFSPNPKERHCMQTLECSSLTLENFCPLLLDSNGNAYPDPKSICYEQGGKCLQSCCSENGYVCYKPCVV